MTSEKLLETILKEIVSNPEEVKVEKKVDEMGVLLEVKLGEGDAGLVIGREGRTIQAIRAVMAVVGAKNRARINVKLLVPERPSYAPSSPRPNYYGAGEDPGQTPRKPSRPPRSVEEELGI